MKSILKIIIALLFILILRKGYSLTRKYLHAKRLKFGLANIKFLTPLDLTNLNQSKEIAIAINIQNFSPSLFKIEQVSIDAYTENGELIASQKEPIAEPLEIEPNKNSSITLNYLIEASGIRKLLQASGGILKVSGRYLTKGNYGATIYLKGFVKSEGFKINVDEKLTF